MNHTRRTQAMAQPAAIPMRAQCDKIPAGAEAEAEVKAAFAMAFAVAAINGAR